MQKNHQNILIYLTVIIFSLSFFSSVAFAQSASPPQPPIKDPTQIIEETHYVDKYFEIDKDGNFKEHIYLGNQKIADINQDNEINYIHTDHLGSPTIITNQIGEIVEINDYKSYGSINNTESTIDNTYKFTGKELDPETNLQYYGARYYDNIIGRFVSVDPLVLDLNNSDQYGKSLNQILVNPQSLNSYSYVESNPVNKVDPEGEASLWAWLSHPIRTARQQVAWRNFSSGVNVFNYQLTSKLLNHSLSLNPGAVDITSGNQGDYGNVIDKIMESSEYQNALNKAVTNTQNGVYATEGFLSFKGLNDLATSIHGANYNIKVTDNNDSWGFDVNFQDVYDYEYLDLSDTKGYVDKKTNRVLTWINNRAYQSQNQGVISKYDIDIQFNDERLK